LEAKCEAAIKVEFEAVKAMQRWKDIADRYRVALEKIEPVFLRLAESLDYGNRKSVAEAATKIAREALEVKE
jgi:hypothetical protein